MNAGSSSLAEWQAELLDLAQSSVAHTKQGHIRTMPGMDKRKKAYQNNYQLTLLDWMIKAFPMVNQLVGVNYFELLVNNYIQQQPLNTKNQASFGAYFPSHLEKLTNARNELQKLPYLVDVAKADWMINQAYYVENRGEFDIEAFSLLDEKQQLEVTLRLSEDVFLLDSHWPILDLWEFHHRKTTLDQIHQSQEQLHFLVTRNNLKPVLLKISEDERSVLQSVIDGHSIASMSSELTPLIAPCIENGWISGFVVP